jgi:hypothetical protein
MVRLFGMENQQGNDQHRFFFEGVEDGLAQLGHIRTYLVSVFLKRERRIGAEQIDAIAHRLAVLGEITAIEAAPKRSSTKGMSKFLIEGDQQLLRSQ